MNLSRDCVGEGNDARLSLDLRLFGNHKNVITEALVFREEERCDKEEREMVIHTIRVA